MGHWFFPNPGFEHKVVSEDAEHVVYINHEGIVMKELKNNPQKCHAPPGNNEESPCL